MKENYNIFTVELQDYTNEELVELFQTTQREEYLKELMGKNGGIIRNIAITYSIDDGLLTMEDLLSIGYEALWKATKYYKAEKGAKFSTVLGAFVRQSYNRIYDHCNRVKRTTTEPLLSYDELEDINKEHYSNDDYSSLYLEEFMSILTGTIRQVAELLLSGLSKTDVARSLALTPATVSYYVKRLQMEYNGYAQGGR